MVHVRMSCNSVIANKAVLSLINSIARGERLKNKSQAIYHTLNIHAKMHMYIRAHVSHLIIYIRMYIITIHILGTLTLI